MSQQLDKALEYRFHGGPAAGKVVKTVQYPPPMSAMEHFEKWGETHVAYYERVWTRGRFPGGQTKFEYRYKFSKPQRHVSIRPDSEESPPKAGDGVGTQL